MLLRYYGITYADPFNYAKNTDEIEVKNKILSLNSSKAIGSKSTPTKTFKLIINDVSSQLT